MGLTKEQKLVLLSKLRQSKTALKEELNQIKAVDPFWFFEPSRGELSPDAKKLLEKWVKEEDRPNQIHSQTDILKSAANIVVMSGGNQTGKSVVSIIDAIIQITGEIPTSIQEFYPRFKLPEKPVNFGRHYGKTTKFLEEVLIPKYQEWMPRKYWHYKGWKHTYNSQQKILRFYKGGTKFIGHISFWTYDQDVQDTQGASLKFIKFDEVPPQKFYDEAKPRFAAGGRIDIGIYATPTEGIGWVENLLLPRAEDKEDAAVEAFEVSSLTNKYINLINLDESLKDYTYEEVLVRLLGQHKSLTGLIYKGPSRIRPEIHLVEPFDLDYDKYVVYRGIDPHPSKPTCCVELAVDPHGNKFVVGSYFEDADTSMVKEMLARRALDRHYRLAWTRYDKSLDYDAKGYDNINIIRNLKLPPNPIPAMIASEKFKGSIDAGVDAIKQDLKLQGRANKPKLFFFKTKEVMRVVNDIQTLERDAARNEAERGKRDKIHEGTKDFHAALRYIYQGNLVWIPPDELSEAYYNDSQDTIHDRYI